VFCEYTAFRGVKSSPTPSTGRFKPTPSQPASLGPGHQEDGPHLRHSLQQMRLPMRLFGSMFTIFAVIAPILSAVGLYAVTAYPCRSGRRRSGSGWRSERSRSQCCGLVLRRSLVQLAIGLPVGIAGAFGVGRLLRSLLVQISSRDPLTIAALALVMAVVSIAACFWPARRRPSSFRCSRSDMSEFRGLCSAQPQSCGRRGAAPQ
jgi:hypothetical protein